MSNWYEQVNEQNSSILDAIKQHPFIIQLMDGTLPKEAFEFYIHQDAIYLAEYKKVLALVGTKCRETADIQFFLDAATGIIHVENALHQIFLKEAAARGTASPTCELYTSYLMSTVYQSSVEVGLAAVLPCFTIYKQVGDYILANQTNKGDNPYQDWIDTYGGEEFANSVQQAVAITNQHAEHASDKAIELMNQAFNKASKLEWMFWDSAYHQELWKV